MNLVTESMLVNVHKDEIGNVWTTFIQKISPEEFEQYKKNPSEFTSKTI